MIAEAQPLVYGPTDRTFPLLNPAGHGSVPATMPEPREVERPAAAPAAPTSTLRPSTTPDAPLTKFSRLLTAGIHAAVLIGLVVFVVLQLSLASSAKKRSAIVKVVAPNLRPVTVPVDGVFTAVGYLPKGTRIEEGQVLGHVRSVSRDQEIESLRERIGDLRKHRLMLRSVAAADSEVVRETSQELRSLILRLETLVVANQQLSIRSPTTGRLEQQLSGAHAVKRDESIAEVWADGGELLLEVEAPLEVLHQLLRQQSMAAKFKTQDGSVAVAATPLPDTLKPVEKASTGEETEIWGVLQCRPESIPSPFAVPGSLGRL